MLVVLIGVSTWLKFVVVTNLSGQMLTFDVIWNFGEVFSSRMNPGFTVQGRWQTACMALCGWAVYWCQCCGSSGPCGVMVWAGLCYGQRTQMHFTEGILNAQRYRDEILRPIVVPFIHNHHLMLQHDNARPHVGRISTQFIEAENIPVLALPAYSPDMSPIEHVWDALDTTACSSSCQYPATSHSHWRGVDQHSTGHNQQPDQLYAKERCCTAWGKW